MRWRPALCLARRPRRRQGAPCSEDCELGKGGELDLHFSPSPSPSSSLSLSLSLSLCLPPSLALTSISPGAHTTGGEAAPVDHRVCGRGIRRSTARLLQECELGQACDPAPSRGVEACTARELARAGDRVLVVGVDEPGFPRPPTPTPHPKPPSSRERCRRPTSPPRSSYLPRDSKDCIPTDHHAGKGDRIGTMKAVRT